MKKMNRTKENITGFLTIFRKETHRFLRLWMQTILPSAITTTLYFLIFGRLIGPRIGLLNGVPYIDFIAPGLIMMSVITNAYANVTSSFFMSKFQRNIEEMLISPLSNLMILLGFTLGGMMRGIIVGLVVSVITLFFTHIHLEHPLIALIVILLSSALFSLAGLLNGIYARNFDDISIIPTFVLTPLTYLGGVFYSISMLPWFWQKISLANPILYIVDAFRYGFIGIADINVYFALGMIVLCVILLLYLNLYLLNKGTGIRT